MTSVASRYYIRLLDPMSAQEDVFDKFTSAEINHKLNGVGSCEIMFEDLSDDRKNAFELDSQVEIYRSVPDMSLDWYVEFEGFHRKFEDAINRDKKQSYSSFCLGFNNLLQRRVIGYREGTIRSDKYSAAETVMKEYVEENCGYLATVANGRIFDGEFPYFSVQSDSGNGVDWSGSRAFENLLDTLKAISDYAHIDFDVIRTNYPGFMFMTYNLLKGEDRTTIGLSSETSKNAAGNSPVILSVSLGNVQETIYDYDRMSEANVCIVLGDGEKSTRSVLARSNDTARINSPWNSIEVARPSQTAFIPGLSEGAAAELKTFSMEQTGDEILEELQAKENFSFSPLQQPSTLYGLHYFLGDRITIRFRDFTTHKRIVGVTIRVQRDTENISLDVASYTTGTQ